MLHLSSSPRPFFPAITIVAALVGLAGLTADITASSPDEKDPFFAPSGDKVYRHPTFYQLPDDIPHM